MIKNTQEINVLVNGNAVKEYVHQEHTYIEAKDGSNFSIRLKNNGGSRVMAIISVDGIDVITGEKASDTQSGYVLTPYSSTEIKGFRIDSESVASFKFTEKGKCNGYAEIKGDASNAGVIGVRIYSEKEKLLTSSEVFRLTKSFKDKTYGSLGDQITCGGFVNTNYSGEVNSMDLSTLNSSLSSMSMNCSYSTGANVLRSVNLSENTEVKGFDTVTEFGAKAESKVVTTVFKIGKLISEFSFLYASKESLKQMGIQFQRITEIRLPDAFDKNMKFCTPPANWKG
jgi:hypothetical protein